MHEMPDLRLSPRIAVFVPLIVLTLVFVLLAALFWQQASPVEPVRMEFLVVGIAVYAVAVAILTRLGLSNVKELEQLGQTDNLSGLPNRRALHEHFAELEAEEKEAALAMVDLDGFKTVNDHYGHVTGDNLIKACAGLFTEVCGPDIRIYRLGGDEFAFLAKGPIAGNLLEGACRRLLLRLTKPIYIGERAITVGASIGLARSDLRETVDSSEMLRRTDVAMYASKHAGKMRVTWFSAEFDTHREAMQKLDNELRAALENEEFRLLYQPLVDAQTRKVVAVEALIRWERPDGEQIGPNVFIPIAEDSGMINAIGRWVLRQAFSDAMGWDEIKLSINVSAAQLRNPEFPLELGYLLEETGFPAERLELEVTETHLVLDSVVAGRSMEVIRGFGVRIVLDDFGTGYASIGFLRKFRFEKLKLDRSMIVDAANDSSSRAMMLASIAIARSMHMCVTAEGVETEDQADMVRSAGCDQIQGWLFFKAMPASDIEELLHPRLGQGESVAATG